MLITPEPGLGSEEQVADELSVSAANPLCFGIGGQGHESVLPYGLEHGKAAFVKVRTGRDCDEALFHQ